MLKKILLIIIYFLSPLALIAVVYNSNPVKYSNTPFLISMVLGAIAYTWLVMEFILGARPKFIERYFGLDKIYRFHGLMAVISVVVVFLHRTLMETLLGDQSTGDFGNAAWIIFLSIIALTLIFMVNSIVLQIKPLLLIRKYAEKNPLWEI